MRKLLLALAAVATVRIAAMTDLRKLKSLMEGDQSSVGHVDFTNRK